MVLIPGIRIKDNFDGLNSENGGKLISSVIGRHIKGRKKFCQLIVKTAKTTDGQIVNMRKMY